MNGELLKCEQKIRQLSEKNSLADENYSSDMNRELNRLEGENHVLQEQKTGFLQDIEILVEENEKFKL